MTFTHALGTNNYGPSKFIVDSSAPNGTHTTIASALTSASSGDTIFIRPGTYTENLTLKAGVNLTAYGSDSSLNGTGNVIISGTCTLTAAGSVTISGIQLQTNSAALLAVTGSAASVVNLQSCYLNISNNSGITFSSSSASATINIINCRGNLGTTGIKIFDHSSSGSLLFQNCILTNSGGSSTASTISSGTLTFFYAIIFSPITSSSTSSVAMTYSGIDSSAQNATCLTLGGSGSQGLNSCSFTSGTASAISISSTAVITACYIASTNTNAIAGAGTLNYNNLTFPIGQTSKLGTTTQVGGVAAGGLTQAPSAGFIGEQISSTATSVATTTTVSKSITSITLTAGVWDISAIAGATATGGTALMEGQAIGISTTNNTLTGSLGVDYFQITGGATSALVLSGCVPTIRAVLTSTTIYYVVVNNTYSSTTCPTNARISATRVG